MDFASLEQTTWDAVVIGSGFGGGAISYALTRKGYRVLLIEKGRSDAVHRPMLNAPEDLESKLAEGRWPQRIPVSTNGQTSEMWPVIGCGLGGSSIHYGATLSRLRPADFAETALPDGQVVEWPFDYAELEPYYTEAEALLNVCGTHDPLENGADYPLLDPPELTESDQYLFESIQAAGLNPFRLHVGLKRSEDCQWCTGGHCTMECKSDVRNTFIDPALQSGGLTVLEQTEAVQLIHDGGRISGVKIRRGADEGNVVAREVVLAAGALFSPLLLMNSKSERFPDGIGNDHDLVGRYLMFHAGDLVAIWPSSSFSRSGMTKSIAFRDFYVRDDRKFGEVQSMGLTAGYGDILNFLHALLERSALRRLRFLRHAARIPAYIASKLLKEATVMSSLVEDYPYFDNRVNVDAGSPSGMRIEYNLPDELIDRVKAMRRMIRKTLSSLRLAVLNPGVELNYGHPCGTCRAGTDPATSVLDKDCRVHGIDNLYVADASFMPTSGGTNPSLTIAANALRVADRIAARQAS